MDTREGTRTTTMELRPFIDGVPALAWSALPDGSLDFVDRRFRDYAGYPLGDQLCGSGWKSIVHREDIQQLEMWWQNLMETQEACTAEVRLRSADGEYRWFQISASPLHDQEGNLVRWYGLNTDVNKLKGSEQKSGQARGDFTITDAIPIGISVLA